MSYGETDGWLLTEHEIDCKLYLVLDSKFEEDYDRDTNTKENLHRSNQNDAQVLPERIRLLTVDANRAVSHLQTVEQIQRKLTSKLINLSLEFMIEGYSRSENLPTAYARVARQPQALPILLKGFFKTHSSLASSVIDRIDKLCEDIYRNEGYEIAYERVAHVQRFAHFVIDEQYGMNYHRSLPVQDMKNLLSAARLHLNIVDFKHRDPDALSFILKRSMQASSNERANPSVPTRLFNGKRYIRNWRVLHLDSLFQFQPHGLGDRFYGLLSLSKDLDLAIYKKTAIALYSGETTKKDLPKWKQSPRWEQSHQM